MTEETSANFHPDPEMQAQEEEKLMNELGSLSPSSLELPPDAETTGSERSGDDDAKHLATNIETRLSMAQEQFAPDENVKRSSDVVPLTAKFEKFKGHLRSLLTLVKAHQEANSELQNSRTFMFNDIAVISHESPLYENVGKMLDCGQISSSTIEEAMELKEISNTQSTICVDQLSRVNDKALEAEYQGTICDYLYEWEQVVKEKVDKLLLLVNKLSNDLKHYQKKVDKLVEQKAQAKKKDKSWNQEEKLHRNEKKLKDASQIYEEEASKLCHLLEHVVDQGWKDLYPLVANTMKWEVQRYENDMSTFATIFPSVLITMDEAISNLEAEEKEDDLEAALDTQKLKNEALKQKIEKLQTALKGNWETKTEFFESYIEI